MEECIEFKNCEGIILRGILHKADVEKQKITFICLNTGLNDMAGWHGIQVKTARYLATNGYNVLRFDDSGIGDSDGLIEEESIVNIFSDIESGMFVQNAVAAVDYVKKSSPDDKIVYLGFCGGGLTAIHAAAYDKRVFGIIDIGGPITLSSNEYLQKVDPWVVKKNFDNYRSKIFKLRPWINFFSNKGDYKTIFKSLIYYLKHKIKGEYGETIKADIQVKTLNLNNKFFESFIKFSSSKRPVLFFYAEIDSATWEFKKYFLNIYKQSNFWDDKFHTYIEAEKANHILSSLESQEKLRREIMSWTKTHFIDSI